jgi:hypothetical protein
MSNSRTVSQGRNRVGFSDLWAIFREITRSSRRRTRHGTRRKAWISGVFPHAPEGLEPRIALASLIWIVEPTNTVAGVAIGPAVQVKFVGPFEHHGGSQDEPVTLTLHTGIFADGQTTETAVASHGVATFSGLTIDYTGFYAFTATAAGATETETSDSFKVTAATANQLLITSPLPDPIITGQPFSLVAAAEDPFGNVSSSYDGNISVALASNPGGSPLGGTTTVAAVDGTASFPNLTLSSAGTGYTLEVSGDGLTSATTAPQTVAPTEPTPPPVTLPIEFPPLPPLIIGEQVVSRQKVNKAGRTVGKPKFVGFTLDYNAQMDPSTAGLAATYQITSTTTVRVKNKLIEGSRPIDFTAAYDALSASVTLLVRGQPRFARGGQLVVTGGIDSQSGVPLDTYGTPFTILPEPGGITPG